MAINTKWSIYLIRRDIKHMIDDTLLPLDLHRYVVIDQADYGMGPASWSWAGSWSVRMDTMGRETWFVMDTPAGTSSKRNFVVLIQYNPDTQVWDPHTITTKDRLIFIDPSTKLEYGEFKVNLIRKAKTHVELHVEMIQ